MSLGAEGGRIQVLISREEIMTGAKAHHIRCFIGRLKPCPSQKPLVGNQL